MLALGAYDTTVCTALGVSQSAWYGWLKEGEAQLEAGDRRSLKVEFIEAVKRARTRAKLRALSTWNKAIDDGDWRASAEFLARRYPDEWSPRRKPVVHQVEVKERPKPSNDKLVDIALSLYSGGFLDAPIEKVRVMVENGTIDDELKQRGLPMCEPPRGMSHLNGHKD